MRSLVLAAVLALAPSLAAAQPAGESRTFAGCDIYACATFTVQYTTALVDARTRYTVTGDGALTLRAPAVTGAYSAIPVPRFTGSLFEDSYLDDLRYNAASIYLLGHAAGDVLALHFCTTCASNRTFQVPALDLAGLSGTFVTRVGAVSDDRMNISLSAVSTVPEPSSLALAAAGLLFIGGAAFRRHAPR